MKQDTDSRIEPNDETTRFYLIFEELAKAEKDVVSDLTLDEIDEIEQVRRMVVDVDDEPPRFTTST